MKEYLDLGQFPEAWIDKDGTHAYIDDGPDQITCEKEKLYPEDHRFLLGFPDKDLTTLTELAEEYAVDDKEVGSDEWTTAINGIKTSIRITMHISYSGGIFSTTRSLLTGRIII